MKPPDVILIDRLITEHPLYKWIMLSNWAIDNGDEYLRVRAGQMILKLLDK